MQGCPNYDAPTQPNLRSTTGDRRTLQSESAVVGRVRIGIDTHQNSPKQSCFGDDTAGIQRVSRSTSLSSFKRRLRLVAENGRPIYDAAPYVP